MAIRKFTYINTTEGFAQEQASNDELSLGKVTAVGVSGVAFDASNQLISNVGTPVSDADAANKQYVDSVASGLDVKASVRLATAAALPTVTAAGSGVGKTLTATANGALSVDSVAVATGNRILVKNQSSGADNGIYVVTAAGSAGTPFVLTRATDADQNAEVTAGMFMFVSEGSTNADSGWVLVTDDPITVDTTALSFSQFSSTVAYTFDQGLSNTAGSIKVEVDTAADAQGAGAGGGSSGLEFDVNSASGKLRAAVHASGGLERSASGLAAKLTSTGGLQSAAGGLSIKIDDSPDTLDSGTNGLKVVGLPSLFKINDTAVGANVTASNVDTLVNAGNADALHKHAKVMESLTANESVVIGDPVAWSTTNNQFAKGDASNDPDSRIFGVATASISASSSGYIQRSGVLSGALSGATAGAPYFLAASGGLTATPPSSSGNRVIRVGWAKNATDLEISIQDMGKKA